MAAISVLLSSKEQPTKFALQGLLGNVTLILVTASLDEGGWIYCLTRRRRLDLTHPHPPPPGAIGDTY